jgi:hypothetical protein
LAITEAQNVEVGKGRKDFRKVSHRQVMTEEKRKRDQGRGELDQTRAKQRTRVTQMNSIQQEVNQSQLRKVRNQRRDRRITSKRKKIGEK